MEQARVNRGVGESGYAFFFRARFFAGFASSTLPI
jgi:hypothetical protein